MSQRRLNEGSEVGSVSIAPYEYAAVYEYLGKNRYLQAAFCKSVQQLYSDKFGMYTTKYLSNIAAEEGLIGLLEWSKEIGCRWDESVFLSGAKGGCVDIFQFLKDKDCPMPDGDAAWKAATERGHLEILKVAHSLKYLHDIEGLCEVAAKNGRLNILKWIHEIEGDRHFTFTYDSAARGGFLDVIKWLRGIGYEWDPDVCDIAIDYGHFGVLKWASDNGCPWDVNKRRDEGLTGLHDAQDGEMIEFLISRGADINAIDDKGSTSLSWMVGGGKLKEVKILVGLGADVNIADNHGITPLDVAVGLEYPEIVEFLRVAGARESVDAQARGIIYA